MKTYEVQYGDDLRFLASWNCEANNAEHAKSLFRKEFGFNYIKIQRVIEVSK